MTPRRSYRNSGQRRNRSPGILRERPVQCFSRAEPTASLIRGPRRSRAMILPSGPICGMVLAVTRVTQFGIGESGIGGARCCCQASSCRSSAKKVSAGDQPCRALSNTRNSVPLGIGRQYLPDSIRFRRSVQARFIGSKQRTLRTDNRSQCVDGNQAERPAEAEPILNALPIEL